MTTHPGGQYRFWRADADDGDLWIVKMANNVDNDQAGSDDNPNHDSYKAANQACNNLCDMSEIDKLYILFVYRCTHVYNRQEIDS